MGYGAAQQYSRDLPTIAGMQEALARQQAQASALGSANFNAAMNRSLSALQHDKELQLRADMSSQDANVAVNLGQMRANAQLQNIQQEAEMTNWLRNQDITQKEAMRLQHLQAGLADIDQAQAAGVLTPQQADEARYSIRMPLDQLKSKQMLTEQRHMEAQTKALEEQAKRQSAIAQKEMSFMAKTAQERTGEIINPVVLAQVKQELTAAGLGNMPFGAFEGLAAQEARKRPGGVEHWFQTSPGNWEKAFESGKDGGGVDKGFEAEMKHYETDHKVWLAHQKAYDEAIARERKQLERFYASNEAQDKIKAGEMRRPTDEELDDAAEKRVRMEPPGDEPLPPKRPGSAGGELGQGGGRQSKADAPPSQAPAPGGKEVGSALEVLQRGGVRLAEREDLPMEAKQVAAVILNEGQRMLQEAGGYDRMSPEQKKRYDQLVTAYAAATKPQPIPGRVLNAEQLVPAPRMLQELSQQAPRRR